MSEAIRLEGVKDLEAALKFFDETAYKKLNKAINKAAGTVRKNARGFIPDGVPLGLSNWAKPATGAKMNGMTGGREFPRWNPEEMRGKLRTGKQKSGRTRSGWGQTVYVEQKSPAGNIYEKAGVVLFNPRTQYSRNPMASLDFKEKLQNFYFVRTGIGRALIRAGIENAGQAKNEISRARYEAELALQRKFDAEAVKNG
ncbi:MAG: hypothetical protein EBR94_06835 [Bacteroidetes bacterium]|nr:hypothetical protein [Bacteroidota bacterium]